MKSARKADLMMRAIKTTTLCLIMVKAKVKMETMVVMIHSQMVAIVNYTALWMTMGMISSATYSKAKTNNGAKISKNSMKSA